MSRKFRTKSPLICRTRPQLKIADNFLTQKTKHEKVNCTQYAKIAVTTISSRIKTATPQTVMNGPQNMLMRRRNIPSVSMQNSPLCKTAAYCIQIHSELCLDITSNRSAMVLSPNTLHNRHSSKYHGNVLSRLAALRPRSAPERRWSELILASCHPCPV